MGLETYNKVWKNLLPQLCLKMYKFNKWIPFTCPNNNNKNSLSRPDMAIFPVIWVWYPCNLFFFFFYLPSCISKYSTLFQTSEIGMPLTEQGQLYSMAASSLCMHSHLIDGVQQYRLEAAALLKVEAPCISLIGLFSS